MAQQTLNIGSNANDGTGDTLRVAMQKVNENFTEVYSAPGITVDTLTFTGNEISAVRSNDDIVFKPAGTGAISFPAIRINGNNIEATRSNDDINLLPSGTGSVVFGAIKIKGTSLSSDDSTVININDGLIVDGTLNVSGNSTLTGATNLSSTLAVASGLTTLSTLSVTGTTGLVGTTTIDNLTFNDNTIGTSSNADLNLTPGGTGTVVISNLKIDDNIQITDNKITTTQSNSDLVIEPTTSGQVVMSKADINGGAIDNTTIGAATPAAGTFTTLSTTASIVIDGVTIADNTISANRSNDNLELTGNGASGKVTISGFSFPITDGSAGQFITTNGNGVLSFASAGATLSNSAIDDSFEETTSSSLTVLNTFPKATFRSAKYYISAVDATNGRHEMVEANITHDGTDAYISTFGSVSSSATGLATYTADIVGANVRLLATPISNNETVYKFQMIKINV